MTSSPVSSGTSIGIPALLFGLLAFMMPFSAGIHLQIIFFYLVLIFVTGYCLMKYRKTSPVLAKLKAAHPFVFWGLIGWIISMSISLLLVMTGDATLSHKLVATIRFFVDLLFFAFVIALAKWRMATQLPFTSIYLSLIAGVCCLIVMQFCVYHLHDNHIPQIWSLSPPFGTHIRDIGTLAAVASLLASACFLFGWSHTTLRKAFLLTATLACWTFLVWNGGRMSIAAALFVLLTIIVAGFIYRSFCPRKVLVIIALVALAFPLAEKLSVFTWNGLDRAIKVSTSQVTTPSQANSIESQSSSIINDKTTSGRITMWTMSLKAAMESPFFGLGPYGYYFIPERETDDQPHNFIVQFIVEWGIVGTSLMLFLLLSVAWFGLKQLPEAFRRKDLDFLLSAIVVLTLTVNGLTDGTYFKFQPLFCLATAFALFPFSTLLDKNGNTTT